MGDNPEVYAAIMSLDLRDQYRFKQVEPVSTHHIRIRHHPDVKVGMRVVKDGKAYLIDAATDKNGREEWLDMIATEMPL